MRSCFPQTGISIFTFGLPPSPGGDVTVRADPYKYLLRRRKQSAARSTYTQYEIRSTEYGVVTHCFPRV